MSNTIKLRSYEYKPQVGVLVAVIFAILAFVSSMHLGFDFNISLYATAAAFAFGLMAGWSWYTPASALWH